MWTSPQNGIPSQGGVISVNFSLAEGGVASVCLKVQVKEAWPLCVCYSEAGVAFVCSLQ